MLMKDAAKSIARSALLELDMYVGHKTTRSELLALIKKLRPLDCGIELVRVGGNCDGGYLIPDDLQGIEYCFSPGVSRVASFEDQLADRHIRSFLADYSVDAPPIMRPEFVFDRKFLGASDRANFFTLGTWKEKYLGGYAGDLLLQMDIEGAEYEVILNAPDSLLKQFRIIVIEFHWLDRLFDWFAFRFYASCLEKLLNYFYVVHAHPNNGFDVVRSGGIEIPPVIEFTFLNRSRAKTAVPRSDFPHRLDADSTARKHLTLPRCWYS
jgi:hypothetical protein